MEDVHGSITIILDSSNHLSKIIASDVHDTDALQEDFERVSGWKLECIEKFRHYSQYVPKNPLHVEDTDELRDLLLRESHDLLSDVQIVIDPEAMSLPLMIETLQKDLREKRARREEYLTELKNTRIRGDAIDQGSQELSIERIRQRLRILDMSIEKVSHIIDYLSTEGWDGSCGICEEPLSIKRVFLAHSLICVDCSQNKERG